MKVALIGDSHTEIVFPALEESISAEGYDIVVSKARRGWSTKSHLNDDLENLLKESNPDVVVFSLGGNNHILNEEKYKAIIDDALAAAKKAGVKKVFWVGPAAALEERTEYRHLWTTQFLKKNLPKSVSFIDSREFTTQGHAPDGVHFKRSQYMIWADKVGQYLLKYKNIKEIILYASIGGIFISIPLLILLFKRLKK